MFLLVIYKLAVKLMWVSIVLHRMVYGDSEKQD
jgi:hypothetical protein